MRFDRATFYYYHINSDGYNYHKYQQLPAAGPGKNVGTWNRNRFAEVGVGFSSLSALLPSIKRMRVASNIQPKFERYSDNWYRLWNYS